MKIKLIAYPYQEHEVGDIVDLGEEKNKSMISLGRAVLYDEGEIKKASGKSKKTKGSDEVTKNEETAASKKKGSTAANKKSFWGKLK